MTLNTIMSVELIIGDNNARDDDVVRNPPWTGTNPIHNPRDRSQKPK